MCGISGIIAKPATKYQENLDKMIKSLHHRGPDSGGMVVFDNCVLGHNRLSIVDLSTGQQPMYSTDHQKALVFNGEIYGYEKIRQNLNYSYQTTSDTEVILALYEQYGEDMLKHLPGMFAFALWDDKLQKLICGRDRFGEKPLYYGFGKNGEFIFGSEIKAILASGLIEPKLDRDALVHYLKYLYIEPNKTVYSNIFVLPPAHQLIFTDGKVKQDRYWQLPVINQGIDVEMAVEQFRYLLEASVKKQLVADVPVGAFLSGGLDSSTIVAVASKFKKQLKTFSFGFGSSASELFYAREVAELYKTDHKELFPEGDIAELLLKMGDVFDEPFADSSNIPTYLISSEASKYVKVILTGDAGDELFGGYDWYKIFLYYNNNELKHDSKMKFMFWKVLAKLDIQFQHKFWKSQASYLGGVTKTPAEFYKALNLYFTDQEINQLGLLTKYKDNNLSTLNFEPTHADLVDYMPGDILTKIDRASMANSIELRAPFLDIDFASFCASLPLNLKVNKNEDKVILRRAYAEAWPESVKYRSKQGFGAPVKEWLAIRSVQALKHEYLDNPDKDIFKLLSFKASRKFVNADNYRTWILLVLSIWMEKHQFNYE